MYKNVLWIDPAVRDYQVFVDSVNADTLAVVYPDPIFQLENKVDRIGFVFEKHGPMALWLQENASVLIGLGVKHMDFLACDTLPEWQGFYDTLTGITVGASNNRTGNLQYGGDWIMESTCEDVEKVYFTQSIEYYKYLLGDGSHSIAIDASGNVWTCGDSNNGQLGREGNNSSFMRVPDLYNITSISIGRQHSMALDASGNVWTCGAYANGRLGREGNTTIFLRVPDLYNISSIGTGAFHSMAVDSSGNLWTCGGYVNGRLGREGNNSIFMRVPDLYNITSIDAGAYHSMVLDSSGNVWTCGAYANGQLGREGNTSIFLRVPDLYNISSIAAGPYHSMVLDASGNVWTCGASSYGRLGREGNPSIFLRVPDLYNIIDIVGSYHSTALDSSGNLWTCGYNSHGQLGREGNNSSFLRVPDLYNISSIRDGLARSNENTDLNPIRLDDISLTSGTIGTEIYLSGNNFLYVSKVLFGSEEAQIEIVSNHLIRVIVPAIYAPSTITLVTPSLDYSVSTFTPIVSTIPTTTFTGKFQEVLTIPGNNLSVVACQFYNMSTFVDAFLVSSTPTQVKVVIPYGYNQGKIYLYDIQRKPLNASFQYIPLQTFPLETRNTSGITQDVKRDLYSWIPSRTDYPTGSYSTQIDKLVVDTNTIYISNLSNAIVRFRTDSRVTLQPFRVDTPIQRLFLNGTMLYMLSNTLLYVVDVTRGTFVKYTVPRVYTGLAFWKDQIYGTDGTSLYQVYIPPYSYVSLDEIPPVYDAPFYVEGIVGTLQQILVVNDRLFVLSDNLIQYNFTGQIELTLSASYACMAYSQTSLLLSTHQQIDQLLLPPAIETGVRWISCTPSEGTKGTLLKMTGVNLDQVSAILFDYSPATILLSTLSTLLFRVPKGKGTPFIEILDREYRRIEHSIQFNYTNTECNMCLPREGTPGTMIYLFGENLDQVEKVYLGSISLEPIPVRKNTLMVIAPDSTGTQTFTLIDREKNVLTGPTFSYLTIYSSICFPGHTLVYSDQGAIEIKKLIAGTNTIYGKDIVAITVTQYIEDTMVQIGPGALGSGCPEMCTAMTHKHKVFLKGKMVEAGRLSGPGITHIPYEGYKVYNVLLATEGRMNVQGMICETLDPSNPIASRFLPHSFAEGFH